MCKGAGWLRSATASGELVRCTQCTNLLSLSRLTEAEKAMSIDDIVTRKDDTEKESIALRFLAKEMLRDPYGFLSIYGVPGNAKSLLLTALIAEFCRKGTHAVYFNADDVASMLSYGDDVEIDGFRSIPGNPDANMNRLKQIPVLAIDELDKLSWTDFQVRKIGALIEHRHRNASTLVTLFAMNHHPDTWKSRSAISVDHLIDRWLDGSFNRFWPKDKEKSLPACLEQYKESRNGVTHYFAPGFFQTKLPSMRRTQRRYPGKSTQPVLEVAYA